MRELKDYLKFYMKLVENLNVDLKIFMKNKGYFNESIILLKSFELSYCK